MILVDSSVWIAFFNGRACDAVERLADLRASYCIEHDHALLHADRDFDALERLRGLKTWRH